MDSETFVKKLHGFIVAQGINDDKILFKEGAVADVQDEYWASASNFFDSLDEEAKEIFFTILRQAKVDTTSLILGILDGVMVLEGQEGDFLLSLTDKLGEPLNGELQSIFLGLEEEGDSFM